LSAAGNCLVLEPSYVDFSACAANSSGVRQPKLQCGRSRLWPVRSVACTYFLRPLKNLCANSASSAQPMTRWKTAMPTPPRVDRSGLRKSSSPGTRLPKLATIARAN